MREEAPRIPSQQDFQGENWNAKEIYIYLCECPAILAFKTWTIILVVRGKRKKMQTFHSIFKIYSYCKTQNGQSYFFFPLICLVPNWLKRMTEESLIHSDNLKCKFILFACHALNLLLLLFLRRLCGWLTETLCKLMKKPISAPDSLPFHPNHIHYPQFFPHLSPPLQGSQQVTRGTEHERHSQQHSESSVNLDRLLKIMPDHSSLSSILMNCHAMTSYFGLSKSLQVPKKTVQEN